ncbi:hypothetical protein BJ878DRAFT_418813, partial [Calycina marina]
KILDASDLDSSRTIRANLRLKFGPARETEYKSNSTKAVIATNIIRASTIRGLCQSHPYGVIALSTTYPTKTWTESSTDVFDGLIKLLKEEKEQYWPEEIVDIMDELERERPMSIEFRILRAKIFHPQAKRRQKLGKLDGPALQISSLPPVQTGELATETLSGPSGIIHHSSRQDEQQNPTAVDSLSPSKENREMKDMYTNAPASNISKMPEPFRTAIENSRLWKWERSQGLKTTGCWPSLFPKDRTQDVSFTIWCGKKDGEHLTIFFGGAA